MKQQALTTEFIRRITGLTEDEYNNILIDSGCAFLHSIIPHDSIGRAMLLADNEYWQWYNRSFHQRCALFVQHLETELEDYLCMDMSQSLRERFEYAHTVAGIKSYQKRTPFYIVNVLYKRIINEKEKVLQPQRIAE